MVNCDVVICDIYADGLVRAMKVRVGFCVQKSLSTFAVLAFYYYIKVVQVFTLAKYNV